MYKNLPSLSQLPFSLECLILQLVTVSLHEPKVLEKYRLYGTTIEQILYGLTTNHNPDAIHKLTDQKSDNHLIGHYIKVKEILSLYNYKPSLNMTVLFDPHTENYSIIIKSPLQDGGEFTKPIRFEGSYKQATESIHISLTPEGQLSVQPVVSFRPNVSRALRSPKVQKQITKLINHAVPIDKKMKLQYETTLKRALISSGQKRQHLQQSLLDIERLGHQDYLDDLGPSAADKTREDQIAKIKSQLFSNPTEPDLSENMLQDLSTQSIPSTTFVVDSYDDTEHTAPSRLHQKRAFQPQKGKGLFQITQEWLDSTDDYSDHALESFIQCSQQVGQQISDLHSKNISHFDIKRENILFSEDAMDFTLIDIPSENASLSPSTLVSLHNTPSDIVSSPGISTYIGNTPTAQRNIAYFIDLVYRKDKPNEIRPILTQTLTSPNLRFCGHAQDCYAYLLCLSEQLTYFDGPHHLTFLSFLRETTTTLLKQIEESQSPSLDFWPKDNLTVSKVMQDLKTICQNNPNLNSYLQRKPVTSSTSSSRTLANFGVGRLVESLSRPLFLWIMDVLTLRFFNTPSDDKTIYSRIQALAFLQEIQKLPSDVNTYTYLNSNLKRLEQTMDILEKTHMVSKKHSHFQTIKLLKNLASRNSNPTTTKKNTPKF